MSRIEEAILRRWSGLRLMAMSAALGAAGVLPLLLYVAFGPKDGNPIGLGLLAVASVPVAAVGMAAGAISALVQWLRGRRG
ncbi:MAG TPA: hypothetical protein VF216_11860 [Mizugakiibacter sp.]